MPDPSIHLSRPCSRGAGRGRGKSTVLIATLVSSTLLLSGAALPGVAQQQDASGGFVLPQGAPPTGLQAPLPANAKPIPDPKKPLTVSPNLRQVEARLVLKPLTIQDAIAVALYTNVPLAQAEESLLKAQGRTSEARAAFNPTLGASFTMTQLSQGQTANFGGQSVTIVNANQKQIGLSATLPIDISGLLRTAVDQARFQEVVARLDINRARNQIVLDVKTAFYNVLRQQELLDVAEESLKNAELRQSDAQKRLAAGVVAPYDVQRASTDVASAQLQVLTAQNGVSQSLFTLKNTMGIDIVTPIQISNAGAVETPPGVPPPPAVPVTPKGTNNEAPPDLSPPVRPETAVVVDPLPLPPNFDALLQDALNTRPEVMEADADIAASKQGIKLAQRSQLPTLGLTVSGLYQPDNAGFSPQTTSAQAVVSLNVPIFEGGVARARTTQARADVATAETAKRQTVDSITFEVQSAYQSLRIARDSLAVANQSLALAREAFRLARVRYTAGVTAQAGVSPLIEVSDAQNALTQAESNQVNALYDYNNARSRLDKAIGRYAFVFNGGKTPAFSG